MTRTKHFLFRLFISISIFLSLASIIIFSFKNNNHKFKNLNFSYENITEIISKLPKKYQVNLEITHGNSIVSGVLTQNENSFSFKINQPEILAETSFVYHNNNMEITYQGISINTSNKFILNQLPIGLIINIENMVYSGKYNSWNIDNDFLFISDLIDNEPFNFKIDLRKNQIASISLENRNIIANFQNI